MDGGQAAAGAGPVVVEVGRLKREAPQLAFFSGLPQEAAAAGFQAGPDNIESSGGMVKASSVACYE